MVQTKGCLIGYLLQHCSVVQATVEQLQAILPGFQAPSESPLPSATNGQPPILGDPSHRLPLQTWPSQLRHL